MTELLLTPQMSLDAEAFDLWAAGNAARLKARKILRNQRSAAAKAGVETRRARV